MKKQMYFYQNGKMISRERVKSGENQQRGLSVIVFYQIELIVRSYRTSSSWPHLTIDLVIERVLFFSSNLNMIVILAQFTTGKFLSTTFFQTLQNHHQQTIKRRRRRTRYSRGRCTYNHQLYHFLDVMRSTLARDRFHVRCGQVYQVWP